jgi:predicted glycosyltransferase
VARTLLLYAQDHKGLGHITRTLTIARHLLAAHPDAVAYVATESPITRDFVLPERCDYIKLPTRLTPRRAAPTPGDSADDARLRRLRANLLRDVALGLAPDLVLVDHEPLGHKGEFSDGLAALKKESPNTKFVFGLRDIMDDIGRIRGQWRELGVYDALDHVYDGIAVYGQPNLFDVADAYAIPASVRPKLHYCGYVVRDLPAADPAVVRRRYGLPTAGGPLLVASVGSGSDGYPVLDAACTAVERLRRTFPDLVAVLVTGPFMPPGDRARLEARASAACRVVPQADTLELMAAADAILGMGGYNSVIEALAAARPLVIVPRATHKVEQQIRAETLAAQGLAQWVHPKDLNGDGGKLAAALEWALRRDRVEHARRVREIIPAFDGATRLTAYLAQWLGGD